MSITSSIVLNNAYINTKRIDIDIDQLITDFIARQDNIIIQRVGNHMSGDVQCFDITLINRNLSDSEITNEISEYFLEYEDEDFICDLKNADKNDDNTNNVFTYKKGGMLKSILEATDRCNVYYVLYNIERV